MANIGGNMVNIGDKLYNWRYGELIITNIERTSPKHEYIVTKIANPNSVVRLDEVSVEEYKHYIDYLRKLNVNEKAIENVLDLYKTMVKLENDYLIEPVKRFQIESLDHWIHSSFDGALYYNNNEGDMHQYPHNNAMEFPINGLVLNRVFQNHIAKLLMNFDINTARTLETIKEIIMKPISDKQLEQKLRIAKLEKLVSERMYFERDVQIRLWLTESIIKFDKDTEENYSRLLTDLIEKKKTFFANDAEFNSYKDSAEKTLKDVKSKIKDAKEKSIDDYKELNHLLKTFDEKYYFDVDVFFKVNSYILSK